MSRSANKVLFVLSILAVHEATAQTLQSPNSAMPLEVLLRSSSAEEGPLDTDAIEMGRTAAEDMGNLMTSPPVNMFHLNQGLTQSLNERLLSQIDSRPMLNLPFLRESNDFEYDPNCVPPSYASLSPTSISRSRASNPAMVPLLPMPLGVGGLPLVQPFFILDALIPRSTPLQRLVPRGVLPLTPKIPLPPLIPSRPLIPVVRTPRIKPIRRLRSSFTPHSYYQHSEPLVLYS